MPEKIINPQPTPTGLVARGRRWARDWIERAERYVFFHLTRRAKEQRFRRFQELAGPHAGEPVLDVGAGTGDFWRVALSSAPAAMLGNRIVAVDLHRQMPNDVFRWRVIADARRLPFRDGAFGVVFSNSVLEHVGGLVEQQRMAREIERVGKSHFLQVPSRWFPIEAHFFLPFLSYLPVRWQVQVTRLLFGFDEEIHLPTRRAAQRLFPGSVVETERFWGLPKAYWIHRS